MQSFRLTKNILPKFASPARQGFNAAAALSSIGNINSVHQKAFTALSQAAIEARTYSTATNATNATTSKTDMFCFQCEQTNEGTGCTTVGVCGKTPEVASLQDLLIHKLKKLGLYAYHARKEGVDNDYLDPVNDFIITSLYATLTNVNFDPDRFVEYLQQCFNMTVLSKNAYESACKDNGKTPKMFQFDLDLEFDLENVDVPSMVELARTELDVKTRVAVGGQAASLAELLTYGLKGLSAYSKEASMLGNTDSAVFDYFHEALAFLSGVKGATDQGDVNNPDDVLAMALKCGETNIRVMELLYSAASEKFGHPSPTKVRTTPVSGKAILVSGHDLGDLYEILKQTEGKGINVYTHGELLPAHGYPGLRKFKHLVGNYGNAWWLQKIEFSKFPGAIVMTTNCIVEPQKRYRDRIFTTNVVGYEGTRHLKSKDFSEVIECALQQEGFPEKVNDVEPKFVPAGLGHHAVLGMADTIINAIKTGDIKRFFLIGGCDGSEGERKYYRDLAKSLPQDNVILTLGCAKYRFNNIEFGAIESQGAQIPRLVDMGQCNDAYSAIKVATALADAFGTKDLNDLPLSFAIAWLEQKAVVVFLTMIKLGFRNIRLGPELPAFVDEATFNLLVDKFNLHKINAKDFKSDMDAMLLGH